uniref:p53 and DNA damage-regulated protein 1 n=1 Tax=Astyanax mexicanus TaxID=7994 RepID=A0A8B9LI44_ASTMX
MAILPTCTLQSICHIVNIESCKIFIFSCAISFHICPCFHFYLSTDKVKVCFGNMFIKFPKENAQAMMQKDQEQLDQEITDLRKRLKAKVNHLNDLQGKPELRGYNLSPLSNDELKAVNSILKR